MGARRVASISRSTGADRFRLAALAALTLGMYVLLFVRGLGWQWPASVRPPGDLPPAVSVPPVAAVQRPPPSALRASRPVGSMGEAGGSAGRASAAQVGGSGRDSPAGPSKAAGDTSAGARTPLPPSQEPPPRDTVDAHGVYYDARGVAVMGIDADPGGVYNVPPGRQVRIGGPGGNLYDVQAGGKLAPATRVQDWSSAGS